MLCLAQAMLFTQSSDSDKLYRHPANVELGGVYATNRCLWYNSQMEIDWFSLPSAYFLPPIMSWQSIYDYLTL